MLRSCLAAALLSIALFSSAAARADDGDEDKVLLSVETDDPRVQVERRANVVEGWQTTFGIPIFTSTEQWESACAAPCKLHVSPHAAYRVSGRGIAASHEFLLPKGADVRIDVHSRSAFWYGAGIASTVVGALLIAGGALSTSIAGNITSTDAEADVRRFGVTFLITGALLAGVGVPLWLTGKSTVTGTDGRNL